MSFRFLTWAIGWEWNLLIWESLGEDNQVGMVKKRWGEGSLGGSVG